MPPFAPLLEAGLDPQRRDLLALTVAVPVAYAGSLFLGAPMSGQSLTRQDPPTPVAPSRPRGYHSTAHIETYYSGLRY